MWREPVDGLAEAAVGAGDVIDTRSNDYLGLAGEVVSRETPGGAVSRWGAGASRLVSGTWNEHLAAEAALAEWLRVESCLLFSSGYAANVGTVSALAGPGETILSDALNHASIVDGCRLSRADVVVLPHAQTGALERALSNSQGVRWVVTESYFGMDGVTPDLVALRALCDRHGAALVVDEAHAVGVFGPEGRGLCAAAGVVPDVLVGGLGKAFGTQGGFVACDAVFRDWLWNRARSLVFSTAPSPELCLSTAQRLERLRGADEERERLRRFEGQLERRLRSEGVPLPPGRHGPVFPVIFGGEAAVLEAAAATRARGVRSQPIRPPTVPAGSSRLRVILRADMNEAVIERLGDCLVEVWCELAARRSRATAGSAVPGGAGTGEQGPAVTAPAASSGAAPGSTVQTAMGASTRRPQRWVVLGTGTGVGKTFVARALVELLAAKGRAVAGLKPIETGLSAGGVSDAARLGEVSFHVKLPTPHPLFGFPDPLTPSLAARRAEASIDLGAISEWVSRAEAFPQGDSPFVVVETAGGVFSPISDRSTNLDLAAALGPATWVLVAPDRLGVLHDVQSCLQAMKALGRLPDWLVLSAPESPDTSTGTNASELQRRPVPPIITLPRNDARPLLALL